MESSLATSPSPPDRPDGEGLAARLDGWLELRVVVNSSDEKISPSHYYNVGSYQNFTLSRLPTQVEHLFLNMVKQLESWNFTRQFSHIQYKS